MLKSRAIAGLVMAVCMLSARANAQDLPAQLPHLTSPPPTMPKVAGELSQRYSAYTSFVELTVSPLGKLVGCAVTSSNVPASSVTSLCDQLRNGQFSPAIDDFGQPAYGMISTSFSWAVGKTPSVMLIPDVDLTLNQLPSGSPIHPVVELALVVDDKGHIEHCNVATTSGVPSLDVAACNSLASGMIIPPVKSEEGGPVRSVRSYFVGFGVYAKLILKHDLNYDFLGDAGPFFPERAARQNVSGYAALDCVADVTGRLSNCVVDEEFPIDFGFAEAALAMAKSSWMKVPAGSGGHVLVRVDFPHHSKWPR